MLVAEPIVPSGQVGAWQQATHPGFWGDVIDLQGLPSFVQIDEAVSCGVTPLLASMIERTPPHRRRSPQTTDDYGASTIIEDWLGSGSSDHEQIAVTLKLHLVDKSNTSPRMMSGSDDYGLRLGFSLRDAMAVCDPGAFLYLEPAYVFLQDQHRGLGLHLLSLINWFSRSCAFIADPWSLEHIASCELWYGQKTDYALWEEIREAHGYTNTAAVLRDHMDVSSPGAFWRMLGIHRHRSLTKTVRNMCRLDDQEMQRLARRGLGRGDGEYKRFLTRSTRYVGIRRMGMASEDVNRLMSRKRLCPNLRLLLRAMSDVSRVLRAIDLAQSRASISEWIAEDSNMHLSPFVEVAWTEKTRRYEFEVLYDAADAQASRIEHPRPDSHDLSLVLNEGDCFGHLLWLLELQIMCAKHMSQMLRALRACTAQHQPKIQRPTTGVWHTTPSSPLGASNDPDSVSR